MNKVLCIAQDDGGGKWTPGTVLTIHPEDFIPNWGDEACFLIVKVHNLTERMCTDIQQRKVKMVLGKFLSPESQEKYLRNKITYFDTFIRDQKTQGHSESELMHKGLYKSFGRKPDFTKSVDMKTVGLLQPTPSKQWVVDTDIIIPKGRL